MPALEARAAAPRVVEHPRSPGPLATPAESAEVDRRSRAIRAELGPRTVMGLFFADRLAELTVRVERCARQERAAAELRMVHAEADFDEARRAEVDYLMSYIAKEPSTHIRRLRAMPEGVDRMIAEFLGLRDELEYGEQSRWDHEYGRKLADLTGSRYMDVPETEVHALSQAAQGDFKGLRPWEGEGLPAAERRAWARGRLLERIDAEVEALRAHRETLDLEAVERDRAGAADRAGFDPSKEAILARKYEAAAERAIHKTLAELRQVEAEAAEAEFEVEDEEPSGSSGTGAFEPPPTPRPMAPSSPVPAFGRVERCHEGPRSVGPMPHGFA